MQQPKEQGAYSMRNFRKKMRWFNYLLQQSNMLSEKMFVIFFLLDILMTCILPLEQILYFEQIGKSGQVTSSLNIFYKIAQLESFLYITDAINAVLLLQMILIIVGIIQIYKLTDPNLKGFEKGYMGVLSFLILLIGEFLGFMVSTLQIFAVRCFFDEDVCVIKTDYARLAINIIGLFFNMTIIFTQLKSYTFLFPDPTIPWARPQSKAKLIKRFLLLIVVFLLVFEDAIITKIDFYIILLPIIAISTIQIWFQVFSITFYSRIVDSACLLKDVIIWNFAFYGLTINLISKISDYSFVILLCFTIVLMFLVLFLHRESSLTSEVEYLKAQNESSAQQKIYQLIYLSYKNNNHSELTLQQLFQGHRYYCEEQNCPCQLDSDKSESCGIVEDIDDNGQDQSNDRQQTEGQKLIYKRRQRNDALMTIIFNHLKKQVDSKIIKFLEIYFNVTCYQRYYSSFYYLQALKRQCTSSYEKSALMYLKMLILQNIKATEQGSKKEIFNVDIALDIDKKFQEYKRLVQSVAVLVDQFWVQLTKKSYLILDLINTGSQIVDSYLQIKELFDQIIVVKPDYKEAVQLHLNFNQEVMNFEIEAMGYQNMLKNIQQKIQITKQSQYSSQKERQGLILVSCNQDKKQKILLVNQVLCEMLGYTPLQLNGQDLTFIIPKMVSQCHEQLVERFLTRNHNRHLNTVFKRIWCKMNDFSILPCKMELQTCVTEQSGIVLVGFIDKFGEIITPNMNCKFADAYFIITDDNGHIVNVSKNFRKKFMKHEHFAIDDLKININDVIIGIGEHSEEDLKDGVRLKMNNYFCGQESRTQSIMGLYSEIMVACNIYNMPKKLLFKEYVIYEIKTDLGFQRSAAIAKNEMIKQIGDGIQGMLDDEILDVNQVDINGNYSSESGSSKSMEVIQQKGTIDYKQIPKSLLNLRRAIIFFFLILIGTSFSVLGVTIIQNNEFDSDSQAVQHSIFLGGRLACLRCAFRMLMTSSKGNVTYNFSYVQEQMEYYFNLLQQDQKEISDDNKYYSQQLKSFMNSENVKLQDLQSDGTILTYNTTFDIAIQRFMSKIQKFMTINEQSFINEFKNYRVNNKDKNPTTNQRDAYFIIINGMYDLRSFMNEMSEMFIDQSQQKKQTYQVTVLIICMTCILVTVISSIAIIPVTFALDSEEEKIVIQWMNISPGTKEYVIQRIDQFILKLQNEKEKEAKDDLQHLVQQYSDMEDQQFFSSIRTQELGLNNNLYLISQKNNQSSIKFDQSQDRNLEEESKLDNSSISFLNNNKNFINKLLKQKAEREVDNQVQMYSSNKSDAQVSDENYNSRIMISHTFDQSKSENTKDLINFQKHNQKRLQSYQEQNTTNHNNAITDDDLVDEKRAKEEMLYQLKSLYRKRKFMKTSIIISFLVFIVGFYIAFYFLSTLVFETASDSFVYFKVANRRAPCLVNAYSFMLETYSQNQTIRIGYEKESTFDYTQDTCLGYEQQLINYQSKMPPQINEISSQIIDINSQLLCPTVFSGNTNTINSCLTSNNGMLVNGLKNAFQTLYYYLNSEMLIFQAYDNEPHKRTQNFLNVHEFNDKTQAYILMIYDYILPSTDFMSDLFQTSLKNYLSSKVKNFLIVFSLFLIFLVMSLIFTLKFVLQYLKKIVFRTRVLVKIIPAEELSEIYKKIRRAKEERNK